tara:strand:+ start:730 stop:1200 length:471 start_codon:yes stop_codon:yes gene_type:complete
MKNLNLFILVFFIFVETSLAETSKEISLEKTNEELRAEHVLTNMQNDYTICYVFYKIGYELVTKANGDLDIAKGIEKSSDTSLKMAYETGELMGLKTEDMSTKVNEEVKKQLKIIGKDFSNSSKLLDKYSVLCKNLIENRKERISFWEKLAIEKFK